MTRFFRPILWSGLLSLLFFALFVTQTHTKAERSSALEPHGKLSRDILKKVKDGRGSDRVRVIVQPTSSADRSLDSNLAADGGTDIKRFRNFPVRVVTLTARAAANLAKRNDIFYVSLNRDVRPLGHLSRTTGADQIRNSGINNSRLDGSGIGIAVIDSGIDADHISFLDKLNNVRVVHSEDFTGEGRTDDPYGHGSHVAALAAGNGRISSGEYVGIAPNANLINLRVLNADGVGTTAWVLAALDWVASNRNSYNIRVVNMSLGMPAIDSYRNDPICGAVRKVVDAGVAVFAAAGNNGKDEDGNKVYGHIHSPGNEPSAITVGASNTFGTDERSDDGVATYSSRGPTRSFYTDDDGVRHYDNLIKPDLVAPGNRLIEAESDGNLLVTQTPSLDAGVSSHENRRMMYLSGSSMAAPVAAGTAALMLQANPSLTPI